MQRSVQPELLDQLPHDDPGAIGSRRDLRRINVLMGNHRWLCKAASQGGGGSNHIIELGAGDGVLARRMVQAGNTVVGLDLAPSPQELPDNIEWREGDFFNTLATCSGDTLVACLILHHFENPELKKLGALIDQKTSISRMCVTEPHRSQSSMFLARLMCPFVNPVTRNDITISVRAGFRTGELATALDLSPERWQIDESTTPLGGYRFVATRLGAE